MTRHLSDHLSFLSLFIDKTWNQIEQHLIIVVTTSSFKIQKQRKWLTISLKTWIKNRHRREKNLYNIAHEAGHILARIYSPAIQLWAICRESKLAVPSQQLRLELTCQNHLAVTTLQPPYRWMQATFQVCISLHTTDVEKISLPSSTRWTKPGSWATVDITNN
jgi:hypothetical protein